MSGPDSSTSAVRTRFAPSPTGRLHLGHAYAAQVARELACRHGGQFLIRFEDIDHTRSREEYALGILEDLQWLGLPWHGGIIHQSSRRDAYAEALEHLKSMGLVYPCFCTRREIETEISQLLHAPHGPEGALYPGTCKHLATDEAARRLAQGEIPNWRLDATAAAALTGPLTFRDLRHGEQIVQPELLGDIVLARRDIGTAYHLAVVVDDAFQGISHVTRGDDLFHATHIHRVLQSLLGYPEPLYLHHALVCDESGKRLAKRHDALSISSLRAAGESPAEVLGRLPALPF
jgi:glutamyl-Q tRNA(Asp) synthetase